MPGIYLPPYLLPASPFSTQCPRFLTPVNDISSDMGLPAVLAVGRHWKGTEEEMSGEKPMYFFTLCLFLGLGVVHNWSSAGSLLYRGPFSFMSSSETAFKLETKERYVWLGWSCLGRWTLHYSGLKVRSRWFSSVWPMYPGWFSIIYWVTATCQIDWVPHSYQQGTQIDTRKWKRIQKLNYRWKLIGSACVRDTLRWSKSVTY